MSQRMREPFHTLMWKASIGYNDGWTRVDPEVLEKFAELLVRECALVANDNFDAGFCPVGDFIKEHFGVE